MLLRLTTCVVVTGDLCQELHVKIEMPKCKKPMRSCKNIASRLVLKLGELATCAKRFTP